MVNPRHLAPLAAAGLILSCHPQAVPPSPAEVSLDSLSEGLKTQGFTTQAVYTDDHEGVLGARFVHDHTAFVFDYLQIQSVPQAFIWVQSYPESDRGEPHTQEHLLLGKGNKGRYVAGQETMSLVSSSAYTQQWRTCYHLYTAAGAEVFFDVLDARLDSLLHPDYTDEEIRREVHHYGVSEGQDGALHLEEKGTVYQEMSSTFERPWTRLWEEAKDVTYGQGHPLAYSSGGTPEAIREMTPEDIRSFHAANYQLGNMGMIGAFPDSLGLGDTLARLDSILSGLQPEATTPEALAGFMSADKLPAPQSEAPGDIRLVDYPSATTQVTADMVLIWPPTRALDYSQQLVLNIFLSAIAGDANSSLYRRLIDTSTAKVDVGATQVFAWLSDDPGQPVMIGAEGIPFAQVNDALLAQIRGEILDELRTIASWSPDAPELAEFNRRVKSLLVAQRRGLAKFVDSPPGFGTRHGGGAWIGHIQGLSTQTGFRRSLTMKPALDAAEALLAPGSNPWTSLLKDSWALLDVVPTVLATSPSPALLEQIKTEREARLTSKADALLAQYGAPDQASALAAFKADYDSQTEALDELARQVPLARFIDNPPMTLDDPLQFEATTLSGGAIPLVRSTFNSMNSTTVGLALSLNAVPESQWVYLAALPTLMRMVGTADGDTIVPYTEMVERLQNEILSLQVGFDLNTTTGRSELSLSGSGSTLDETRAALEWMGRVLYHPDWRPENLARLRDVVNESLTGLRQVTRGSEESWVNDPARAWRYQDNPLALVTSSFMTRTHLMLRLRWLLAGDDTAAAEAAGSFIEALVAKGKGKDHVALEALIKTSQQDSALAALPEASRSLVTDALEDLEATLVEMPPASLSGDWAYLCAQIAADLRVPPAQALANLNATRELALSSAGARLYIVGSAANMAAMEPDMQTLVSGLGDTQQAPIPPAGRLLEARLAQRGIAEAPLFVGLVNNNTQSGVFLHSAKAPSYTDLSEEDVLTHLAGQLYSGGGAHGLFMKTWASGLAYSNGARIDPRSGTMRYYAERSPELPRTMTFVVDTLKNATFDPTLGEYAVSVAFEGTRAAMGFESRGAAMAADLADGLEPQIVRDFRTALLQLRSKDDLAQQLFDRMPGVYGRVLVGLGPSARDVEGASFMTIGPDAQLDAWQAYLHEVEGQDAELVKIYARDFWLTGPAAR